MIAQDYELDSVVDKPKEDDSEKFIRILRAQCI